MIPPIIDRDPGDETDVEACTVAEPGGTARLTYAKLRDFLDGYTNDRGVIQGDPATIAAEAVGFGIATADEQYAVQFED